MDLSPLDDTATASLPFSARLLGALDRTPANLCCSPASAQIALTLAALGARGETRAQFEQVLGGTVEHLAGAAGALEETLAGIGGEADDAGHSGAEGLAGADGAVETDEAAARSGDGRPERPRASLSNAVWVQQDLPVESEYREALASLLGDGLSPADFTDEAAREAARERMNTWVEDRTGGLIADLVPPEAIDALTRLVLITALHLQAAWPRALDEDARDSRFVLADGRKVPVRLLRGTGSGWYADERCTATMLPTIGGRLGLVLVRPTDDLDALLDAWAGAAGGVEDADVERVDGGVDRGADHGVDRCDDHGAADGGGHGADDGGDGDADRGARPGPGLADVLAGVLRTPADSCRVGLPAFRISSDLALRGALEELGITDAFGPRADLRGITAQESLSISSVLQKATVAVDREGMEAAAATAVMVGVRSMQLPAHELVLDRPFVFLAVEKAGGTPLVMGRVGDPKAAS